ncbi:MAG: ABC transporter substrate-binding protein, partial [Bacteroidetes bacterium QH_6_64_77]
EKPDVIVGLWGPEYDSSRLLDLHPAWDVVPALRNDRVYSFPSALFARPAPRILQGARRLAQRLHPELFSPSSARSRNASSSPSPTPSDP